jgi:hypothetical protein
MLLMTRKSRKLEQTTMMKLQSDEGRFNPTVFHEARLFLKATFLDLTFLHFT